MLPYADLAGFDENNEYNENPLRYGVYRRGFVGERLRLCTTSQALRASSPSRGASGETGNFAVLHYGLLLFPSAAKPHLPAKGSPTRGAVERQRD